MTGVTGFGRGRSAGWWGAMALALSLMAGCATGPAPIYRPGPAVAAPQQDPAASASRAHAWPERPSTAFGAPEILPRSRPLQCVPYARQRSGIEIYGDAYTWWDQAEGRFARVRQPQVGAVMATYGYRTTTRGHVAFVTAVLDARMILVDHANWLNGGEISVNVPVIDVSPANDWSQIRVWHIPGSHWGGRVYDVQGFILAEPVRIASS